MACPQKEKGYTPLAHEIMEALAVHDFNGRERAILDIILRETYGRHRTANEFPSSLLGVRTGIDPAHVRTIVRKLVKRKVLMIVREASFERAAVLGLQKDYDQWLIPRRGGRRVEVPQTQERTPLRLVRGGSDGGPEGRQDALGTWTPEGPPEARGEGPYMARPDGPYMARPEGPYTAPPTAQEANNCSASPPRQDREDREDREPSLSPDVVLSPAPAAERPEEGERDRSTSRTRTGTRGSHPAANLPELLRQRLEAAASPLDLAGPSTAAWAHLAKLWEVFRGRGGTEDELVAGYEAQVHEVDGRRSRERIIDATFCAAKQLGQALSTGLGGDAPAAGPATPGAPRRSRPVSHRRGCPCPGCRLLERVLELDDGRWTMRELPPPAFAATVREQMVELQPELVRDAEALGGALLHALDQLGRGDQLAKTHRSPSLDLEQLARSTAAWLRKAALEARPT